MALSTALGALAYTCKELPEIIVEGQTGGGARILAAPEYWRVVLGVNNEEQWSSDQVQPTLEVGCTF